MKQFTGYMHGVDLGGWLSQCEHTQEHYERFITKEDIKTIRSWGLDHIRIPVDYDLVEEKNGTYKEDGFAILQKAIDWCGEYGLNMVLDLHKTYGYSFDSGEKEAGFFESPAYQERFFRLWEEFSRRYGKYADRVSFELLNEVTDDSYAEPWNRISAECIRRIRLIAPNIHIIIGGCRNNHISMLKKLDPPADENIVYNFHLYDPLIFTHQGAYWIPTMDTSFRMPLKTTYGVYAANSEKQLHVPDEEICKFPQDHIFGVEFFEDILSKALRVASERNVPLYCGEYGVIDRADPRDTLDCYKMFSACFDRFGIGRAAWNFRGKDFGLVDEHLDNVREELIKYL